MNLLFIDTETGGLDPCEHSLLQVGMVAYSDKKIINKGSCTIREEKYSVTSTAMNINKLNLSEVYEHGLTKQGAVSYIKAFVKENFGKNKPVLVGHNIAFDRGFLKELFKSVGANLDDTFSHRTVDTMTLIWALNYVNKLPLESCSGEGAFKYFNIMPENYHDALEDATATVFLFEKLIELMENNNEII